MIVELEQCLVECNVIRIIALKWLLFGLLNLAVYHGLIAFNTINIKNKYCI